MMVEGARYPKALSNAKLSKSTASYKMNYGLAKTITDNLAGKLKNMAFSLNSDESQWSWEESAVIVGQLL